MANAIRTVTEVEKIVVETVESGFTLKLTDDEALTLMCILHRVGGNPEDSRRGHASAIRKALIDAGFTDPKIGEYGCYPEPFGSAFNHISGEGLRFIEEYGINLPSTTY